jgi:hypothetical protein
MQVAVTFYVEYMGLFLYGLVKKQGWGFFCPGKQAGAL